jgi:hypothetical protein
LNYGLDGIPEAQVTDRSPAAQLIDDLIEDSIGMERNIAFAALITAISSVVTAVAALADSLPQIRNLISWTAAHATYFQAGALMLAFLWLAYAWRAYRQMARARDQLIRARLVDLWLADREREPAET